MPRPKSPLLRALYLVVAATLAAVAYVYDGAGGGAPTPRTEPVTSGSPAAGAGQEPSASSSTPTGSERAAGGSAALRQAGGRLITPVSQVQGRGAVSPLVGQTVTIEGVVVGDFQRDDGDPFGTDLGGFFVQEEDAFADDDPLTSEGVFVFGGSAAVSVGDRVHVTGRVEEYDGATQIGGAPSVAVLASGVPLPSPARVELPVSSPGDLEAYEGMLVTFQQELTVVDHADFDRYGELLLAAGGRPRAPTARLDPRDPAAATALDLAVRSRVVLDDGRRGQNPDPLRHPDGSELTSTHAFRAGDVVTGLTGVLTEAFGSYRVHPTRGATFVRRNPRPEEPPRVGGSLRAASFNVLNYFDDVGAACGPRADAECRGADDAEELRRQRAKLVAAITALDAHVVALMELENDADQGALRDLVAGLNAAAGPDAYAYVDAGAPLGRDSIRVALVYRPDVLRPVGEPAVLATREFLDPLRSGQDRNRPALAQTFAEASGERFTVVALHLKSRASACGAGDDDAMQGSCNGTRAAAARELVGWLMTDPTGAGDPDVLVLGDLNAYAREDPLRELTAAGYVDLLARFASDDAYTYVHDGLVGNLDHALASASLANQVTGAAPWHVNADEPDVFDYDTTFKPPSQRALYAPDPFRSSDHDPVLVGLELGRR